MALFPLNFLSPEDAKRASRTFEKLLRHDIRNWALTGGLAQGRGVSYL